MKLIDDCVMLPPETGYAKAIEKLEKRFGKTHKIAQSYIYDVIKGGKLKLNDVEALVQLADDVEKCQTVLSQLKFSSDLNATGTLQTIVKRLPDCFQMQWVKRSSKIFNRGSEPTFQNLTTFVEERANEFSSKYGQFYAEDHSVDPDDNARRITTLATDTKSTAGHDNRPRCLHCDRMGHIIWKCFKFKSLSIPQRRDVAKKLDLCLCCLKNGHGESNCDRTCMTCGGDHHTLLHPEQSKNGEQQENQNEN